MTKKTRRRRMDRKIIEYLIQGKGTNETCRLLHVSKGRISKVRALGVEYGYLKEGGGLGENKLPPYPEVPFPDREDGRCLRLSKSHQRLQELRSWIEARLNLGWHKVSVFEELPIKVSRSSFYRYLHIQGLNRLGEKLRRRVVPEIIHQPGEALLLDWGKLRDVIDPETGKKRTLWVLAGILGFSRYLMVRLVWSNDTPTTLTAIESMLKEIGGVPFKITSDNPKCFTLKACRYEPILNPAYERFASHYGAQIESLPPRDPEKKGKIERPIPYLRRLYEAHGDAWYGIEESQNYMIKKLNLANQRKHGTTQRRPIDLLIQEETQKLKPLPNLSYEIEEVQDGTVRKDGHVRFANKYYSLDEKYINREVAILGNSKRVSIYLDNKLVETHERILARDHRSKSTKEHHLKPWERSMQDPSTYRQRGAQLGPEVEKLILKILEAGKGFIDTRKTWGILSLDKTYPKELINEACGIALGLKNYSYLYVKGLLEEMTLIKGKAVAKPQKRDRSSKNYKLIRKLDVYQSQLNLLEPLKTKEGNL